VGEAVGTREGVAVGATVSPAADGLDVGTREGEAVGAAVGSREGLAVGSVVGSADGAVVGAAVGTKVASESNLSVTLPVNSTPVNSL